MEGASFQVAGDAWVGSGPRHDIAASGTFARPRSTAAEQGYSVYPMQRVSPLLLIPHAPTPRADEPYQIYRCTLSRATCYDV